MDIAFWILPIPFERVNSVKIPYEIGRRVRDITICNVDIQRTENVLGWGAENGIEDMCRDSWRWQQSQSEK